MKPVKGNAGETDAIAEDAEEVDRDADKNPRVGATKRTRIQVADRPNEGAGWVSTLPLGRGSLKHGIIVNAHERNLSGSRPHQQNNPSDSRNPVLLFP